MNRRVSTPWHVGHVIGSLRTGGAERQLVNYLLAANRTEFRHTVYCLEARGELAEIVESAGIPVQSVAIRRRYAPWSVGRFASRLRSDGIAILHAHMHDSAMWARLSGRLAGVPVMLTTEHGKELWKGPVRIAIDHHLSRWTARHIAVSRDGMELRQKRERLPAEKMILIPNGVRIPEVADLAHSRSRLRDEFGLAQDDQVIGTVGRVVAAKGYEHLLGALAILRRDCPRVRWLAVGDGDLRGALAERAVAAGLGDAVVWAGRRSDVDELLATMDIWVMSSIREGLPVALLEAMAAGCPIVATDVGGIPDAVRDAREGLIVPAGDAEALAYAIARMLSDRSFALKMGAAARARAIAEYGIMSVAERIESVYRDELAAALRGGE